MVYSRKQCRHETGGDFDDPPSNERVPLLPPATAVSMVSDAPPEPKDIISILPPILQAKLLDNLLPDPTVASAVSRAMEPMYPVLVPALAASIRARLASALEPVRARTAHGHGADFSDMNDYVRAARSLLPDVVVLARVPHPGAARAAYEVLLALVFATDPDEECTVEAEGERVPFDAAADDLLVWIARRRRAEEGECFVVGEELEMLQATAATFAVEFEFGAWFAKSIALLEEYTAGGAAEDG